MAGRYDSRNRSPPDHQGLHGFSPLESGRPRTVRRPDRSRRHRVQDRGQRWKRRRLRTARHGRGRGAACLGFANRTLGTLVRWDEQRNSNGDASSRRYREMECSGGRRHVSAFGANSGGSSFGVDRVAFGVSPDGRGLNRRKPRGASKEPRLDGKERPDPGSDATRTLQDVADRHLEALTNHSPARFCGKAAISSECGERRQRAQSAGGCVECQCPFPLNRPKKCQDQSQFSTDATAGHLPATWRRLRIRPRVRSGGPWVVCAGVRP